MAKQHIYPFSETLAKEAMNIIIEAAYHAGFEPSSDSLTLEQTYKEAQNYLTKTELLK